ncbi:glycoside hydrolase family 36 protein [Vibrio ostreicida]|uniref:Alpha-galactosidase n=1 Tax=Vibrio ostreicida TaxID=526588 RepID=A0ABT8BRM7_9VIBR|nr:alpha-galactosidase [Vibrio ostreicida]MDN3609618.1 alpha-galactosidase [Vibrio ostreicida]NPD08489.1 glycosyl hydrolase [Vibrio ostreicida]
MSFSVTLENGCSLRVRDINLKADLNHNEVGFVYQGLSNDRLSNRYVLALTEFTFEPTARLLGDGFQMLAQTGGTVEHPIDIGRCADNGPLYRLYSRTDPKRYYNYLVVEHAQGFTLFGFTSCYRFAGYFEIADIEHHLWLKICIDGENTYPLDWASNQLEYVAVLQGHDLDALYTEYATLIAAHHPVRAGVRRSAPVGWCSWYSYYEHMTQEHVLDNISVMHQTLKTLEYVLIDDGYQAFMGDWLTPSTSFPTGVEVLAKQIINQGKKPAIWLAPFIAQAESTLFKDNPDWFLAHEDGQRLKAEDITYGGWRNTPWYILDTSNPDVQEHLTSLVRTMREQWGVGLFKLDANYWGALKGVRQQKGITGVEAYRLGMEAIIEGAGDAILLGCNAPMWPSLGLVDAMRICDDVERDEKRFERNAQQTFYRCWQHRRLWQIDPDCLTLVSLPDQSTARRSYQFHRDVLLASGGLLFSGDPLPDLTPFAYKSLSRLFIRHKHTQHSAQFRSLNLHYAYLTMNGQNELHCLFNFDQPAHEVTLTSDTPVYWRDYWTGEKLNHHRTAYIQVSLAEGLSSRAIVTARSLAY